VGLGPQVHELLRRQFHDQPAIEVVVERRVRDRRSTGERRAGDALPGSLATDHRVIRNLAGRRVGERRAPLLEITAPMLPRKLRRFARDLVFVERLEPATQAAEDLDTSRLVLRIQAGERNLFAVLYTRYFDRVYSYMRALLHDAADAEDATQQVFVSILEALPRYELRSQPFRAWLFTIVRNRALRQIEKRRRLEPTDPVAVAEVWEAAAAGPELEVLDWLSDRELTMFVERLPLLQRQVLLLRYLFDLPAPQVAQILERSSTYVRKLEERSLAFLRTRLMALGRSPRCEQRREVRGMVRQVRVLRARRWALVP
jgi:RNA polymerase sigma-70 factor (ECF subfamily)